MKTYIILLAIALMMISLAAFANSSRTIQQNVTTGQSGFYGVIQQPQSPTATNPNVYDPRFPPILPKGPVCVVHQPWGDIVRTDNFCAPAIN